MQIRVAQLFSTINNKHMFLFSIFLFRPLLFSSLVSIILAQLSLFLSSHAKLFNTLQLLFVFFLCVFLYFYHYITLYYFFSFFFNIIIHTHVTWLASAYLCFFFLSCVRGSWFSVFLFLFSTLFVGFPYLIISIMINGALPLSLALS